MGCGSSKDPLEQVPDPQTTVPSEFDSQLADDAAKDRQIKKLLLLGPGASGKSTLFKQMITIYGKGFSDDIRQDYIPVIHGNILTAMKTLIKENSRFGSVLPGNEKDRDAVLAQPEDLIDKDLAASLKRLWNDPGIQAAYDRRSKFQLNDSTEYFFEKLDEVASRKYMPSNDDLFRSRIPTTGIEETRFDIDKVPFMVLDVGGQRSERKKWIHCFENVTAVLFVAAISEYDQVLWEDDRTNRMVETLRLFQDICNSEWFERGALILFLNKRDLFKEKVQRVPLKNFFPGYTGADTYEEGTEYIKSIFESLNKTEKKIYSHLTCATDTNNVFMVFNYVKDIIIQSSLEGSGMA